VIDHPQQRTVTADTLTREGYLAWLKANLKSLNLEYAYYHDRGDTDSCYEIMQEYKALQFECVQFLRAEKRQKLYHGGH
jgi:hypothetical protein